MSKPSHELHQLYDQYDAWISGRATIDVAAALDFKRRFRAVMAEVALIETGIEPDIVTHLARIDIAVSIEGATVDAVTESRRSGSNVVLLSDHKLAGIIRRAVNEGDSQ